MSPQVNDDAFEETSEPSVRDNGEYFLARYRRIDPTVVAIDPASVRHALRVNPIKTGTEALIGALSSRGAVFEKISWLRFGYFVAAPFSMGSTPEYLLGKYYLQAPLSQLACEALDPSPGSRVLDMAAAPGSKTTYLATIVGEDGAVVALDNDATRLAAVRNNAERLGLLNVVCVKKDARFATDLGEKFPFVLLDAPCSGNYCSEDGWFGSRTIQHDQSNARVQRELLKAAVGCLVPGGRLVYSTCSLEPEEDECLISWALTRYPELDVVPLDHLPLGDAGLTSWDGKELDPRVAGTRRFWPHKTGCEGFYIASLKRKG
jgi:NOL1/NOP2/sun family putative RNA methylase